MKQYEIHNGTCHERQRLYEVNSMTIDSAAYKILQHVYAMLCAIATALAAVATYYQDYTVLALAASITLCVMLHRGQIR